MKRITIMLAVFCFLLAFAGCSAEPVSQEDRAQIEVVLREYYEAMNRYDLERFKAIFSEETWSKEGYKISGAALFVKNREIKLECLSITSIKINGDTARVVAQVESRVPAVTFTGDKSAVQGVAEAETNLTRGEDKHYLLRKDGSWEITGPLNVEENELSTFFTPNSSVKAACSCSK